MIGFRQARSSSMLQQAARAFSGGGPKIPAIDPKITDFDVVVVGKSPILG